MNDKIEPPKRKTEALFIFVLLLGLAAGAFFARTHYEVFECILPQEQKIAGHKKNADEWQGLAEFCHDSLKEVTGQYTELVDKYKNLATVHIKCVNDIGRKK
jgi:hypothetical protein